MQGSRDPLFLQLYFHTCTLRVFGKHTRPIQSGFEPIKKLVQVQVNELRESVSAKKKKRVGGKARVPTNHLSKTRKSGSFVH